MDHAREGCDAGRSGFYEGISGKVLWVTLLLHNMNPGEFGDFSMEAFWFKNIGEVDLP